MPEKDPPQDETLPAEGDRAAPALSDRDWDRLTAVLAAPPAPNERLRRLLGR